MVNADVEMQNGTFSLGVGAMVFAKQRNVKKLNEDAKILSIVLGREEHPD